MEFKFDGQQEYQIAAIQAITNLFNGQPPIEVEQIVELGYPVIPNHLNLTIEELFNNLQVVQRQNKITPDNNLKQIEVTFNVKNGRKTSKKKISFPNFSVEMETGTGKTYVYIRTALELFTRYNLRKFIIVVPSVAVREGVMTTLRVTKPHLSKIYGNINYRFYVYESENLNKVRQFASADTVEFMVMTIDSFNKDSNVVKRATDALQGETPIHLIQAAHPILILDEPQSFETEPRINALAELEPLFALRYSATHKNPYNLVYRLTPYEAYRQGLVKRIEVAAVVKENDNNQPYIRLNSITPQKKTVKASLTVHKLMKDNTIKVQTATVEPGDSLEEVTGRIEYKGYEVAEINANGRYILFANDEEFKIGEEIGATKEAIFEAQIRYTIEEHFRKQRRLKHHDVKVLSLFFIDRVGNYTDDDGIISQLFIKNFNDLKAKYSEWNSFEPESVQAAYFANSRKRDGSVTFEDSTNGEAKKDEAAYALIMKRKEQLLSFAEPVSFIFSHSALGVGWDNPNIFQICTLNQTVSTIKKRQEIGRGVRLAVNQSGERVFDETVNILTVIANESYERYVATLQSELTQDFMDEIIARYGKDIKDLTETERQSIIDEYGIDVLPPKPSNAANKTTLHLRDDCNPKRMILKPEFKELWDKIKERTRYSVEIDSERLLDDVLPEINEIKVQPPQVVIGKGKVELSDRENVFEVSLISATRSVLDLRGSMPLPIVVQIMANLMDFTTPSVRLSKRTLLELCKRTSNHKALMSNPHEFAAEAVRLIKYYIADQLVNGIQYDKIGESYLMGLFEEEVETSKAAIMQVSRSAYDQIMYDSDVEKAFIEELERRPDVRFYLKLPRWFTVPTPIGEYNPDWAIVMENRDEYGDGIDKPLLYLVRETKGKDWQTKLRPDERRKLKCGAKHFNDALNVSYQVVVEANELPYGGKQA